MAFTLFLFYLLIIIIISVSVKFIWSRRYIYILSWKLSGPLALPIVGNALHFLCKNEDIFDRAINIINKYPSPTRLWLGPKFTIFFHDIYHAEKIMSSMKFAYKDEVYRFLQIVDGHGLITGSGPKWKRDRKLMSRLFIKNNVTVYFPVMLEHANRLTNILKKKKMNKPTFSVDKYFHRCASDIVNETILGIKTNAQNGDLDIFLKAISRMYILLHSRIVKVWLQVEWIFKRTRYYNEQTHLLNIIHGFMRNVLQQVAKTHIYGGDMNATTVRSFLDQMLDIRDEVPNYATDEELVHHMTTLYTASEDTTLAICSYTLVLLGMYPNIQNKVVDEIYSITGKTKRNLELVDIEKLHYLEMCIKDVLRLFPIAPFIMRKCTTDCQIDDLFIPKNCAIIVSIHSIHRDSNLWEKPNEFYPEHFLPETVKKRNPFAFMPFSAGPRGCLGKTYAYQILKTILATVLQTYIIESDGKLQDKGLKADISVRFKDDYYPIRIKERKE